LPSPANRIEGCPRVVSAGSNIAAGDLVAWGFIPGKKMQQPGVSAGGTIDIGRVFVFWICVGSVDASNPGIELTG